MMTIAPGDRGSIDDPRKTGAGIRLLLWGLQSPVNVGMVLRVAESYRVAVGMLGSASVLADPGASATVSDFACGALQRIGLTSFADDAAVDAWRGPSRLVATSIDASATALPDFHFRPGDVVALGNEYDGLPADVVARADARIVIPMADVWTPKPQSISPIDPSRATPVARDGQPNLNVAVAGAIICYAAYLQAQAGGSAD
jgi:tRNA (cytidine/uridine-2'-O-)-methyltransferase